MCGGFIQVKWRFRIHWHAQLLERLWILVLHVLRAHLGHTAVILDDITLEMSTMKSKVDGLSQRERLNRLIGHMRSHHPGGMNIFVCQQHNIL